MTRILIVGAGLSGATIARELAERGYHVHVIEQRDHIAGNCYDYVNDAGILMNKYGAHLFHTNSERVWTYVNRFSEWVPWKHDVIGRIGDNYFPIPVNIDTVNTLCGQQITTEAQMKEWLASVSVVPPTGQPANSEEVALMRVGPTLYEKIFKDYTYKQWEKWPAELAPSVLERIPVRSDWDPHYFSDKWQALPAKGYTAMVAAMLEHPNIHVEVGKGYDHTMRSNYDYVFYTGPIDQYYAASGYPKLEYRSIRFEEETLPIDKFQTNSVVNYPSMEVPWTRIVEYKHFLNQDVSGKTTIVREYTMADGDPYYPVPTAANQETYRLYQSLAQKDEGAGVFFVGRLANYKYYNMDAAILAALEAVDKYILSI
jgi:UDP-galactopyranose mutase